MLDQTKGNIFLVYDPKCEQMLGIEAFWSPEGSKVLTDEMQRVLKSDYKIENFNELTIDVRAVKGYFWVLTWDETEECSIKDIELNFYTNKEDYDKAVNDAEFLSTMGGYSGSSGKLPDIWRPGF